MRGIAPFDILDDFFWRFFLHYLDKNVQLFFDFLDRI